MAGSWEHARVEGVKEYKAGATIFDLGDVALMVISRYIKSAPAVHVGDRISAYPSLQPNTKVTRLVIGEYETVVDGFVVVKRQKDPLF